MRRSLPSWILGALVVALDQASKRLVMDVLSAGPWSRRIEVIPGFFNLTLVGNTGAAWGLFKDQSFWLTLLAFAALIFLFAVRRHFTSTGPMPRIALGLLLGGIAGNLVDRLTYGHVVDFLCFYLGHFQWPAFNVADSAICTGVGLYLIDSFRRQEPHGTMGVGSQEAEVGGRKAEDGS